LKNLRFEDGIVMISGNPGYKNNVAFIKNGVCDGIQLDLLIPIKERGY